eukprot:TRINITY_DN80467_c0_g1_i1.p1 TRINITY_DN80467_c0_g1~~TRINITY_DN80467_c0_g1_i1.p1  ORF type:complete len:1634 (-),score=459.42 TRINITY_DN80467_c0_g1_i1:187-5040(-)
MKRKAEAVEDEEAFPRGRPKAEEGVGRAAVPETASGDVAGAGEPDGAQPTGTKTRRKRRKGGQPDEDEDVELPQVVTFAPRLRMPDLAEGTLLVCAVREACDDELTLNLPYNMSGQVSRAQALEPEQAEAEDMPSLPQLYSPGQLVVAVVLGVFQDGKRTRIDLSLRPSLINAGLTAENAAKHMVLSAVVESEEEHVLRLSFGVEGLRGVLKKAEVKGLPRKFRVGSILQVSAQAVNAGNGTIKCAVAQQPMAGPELTLDALKAGFLVNCKIEKILAAKDDDASAQQNAGLIVNLSGVLKGYVHWHHQSNGVKKLPQLKHKQIIAARIIAVVRSGKDVTTHLSLLPHLVDWTSCADSLKDVKIGQTLKSEVVDCMPKFGLRLKCGEEANLPAFCPISRLQDKEGGEAKRDPKIPKVGSSSPCRVLGCNFLEGIVVVTRRPNDLSAETLLSVAELSAGQLVVGTIKEIADFGVFVQLSEYVTGLVHLRHLTDVPLAKVSKKHQVGGKLKCRVLGTHVEKRQLSLTAKPSLVKDKFPLARVSEAKVGMIVTGYVQKLEDYGAIVSFFQGVHGLVPKEELAEEEGLAVGMIVRVKIAKQPRPGKGLRLTLDLEGGREPDEVGGAGGDTTAAELDLDESDAKAAPGDIVTDVIATKCVDDSVVVTFKNSVSGDAGLSGVIPKLHLSDDMQAANDLYEQLAKKLKKAKAQPSLAEGVVLSNRFDAERLKGGHAKEERKTSRMVVLISLKPTLHQAAVDDAFIKEMSELKQKKVYNGYVKDVLASHVTVSLGAWKLAGIAGALQIKDKCVEKASEVLSPGQSVRAMISKIDVDKKRFQVDLRASKFVKAQANDIKWAMLKKGTTFPGTIAEISKNFLWVKLTSSIKGQVGLLDACKDLASLKSPASHFQVGQNCEAQVLQCVSSKKRLDLSLLPSEGGLQRGKNLGRLVKIEDVKGKGIAARFALPHRRRGVVHITELFDTWAQFPLKRLRPGSFHEVFLFDVPAAEEKEDKEDKEEAIQLSLRSSLVHGQAAAADEKRPEKVSELQRGQKVSGYVVNANDKGVFVALSRTIVGRIRLKCLSDQMVLKDSVAQMHPIGELIRDATVLEVDEARGSVELSLVKGQAGKLTVDQLSVGDIVSGVVRRVEPYGLFVRLDNSMIDVLVHKTEVSDSPSVSVDSFKAGSPIQRALVLKIDGKKVNCGIKASLFEDVEVEDDDDDDEDEDMEDVQAELEAQEKQKKKTASEEAPKAKAPPPAAPVDEESEDEEVPWIKAPAKAEKQADAGFQFSEFQGAEESDSGEGEDDDEDSDDEDPEKKRPTKRQKKAQKAAEAKELAKQEAENAAGAAANDPKSVEDFEKLLLTQGDTSIIWIRYMAFHLKMSDLVKARGVVERAVKHVGFAEAKERFNVWVAYMNLECTFGTEQTADAIFKRAASHNDAKEVHLQLARIHERNKKPEQALKVYDSACKKFAQSKQVWLAYMGSLYTQGDLEAARKALPRALAAVPKYKHPLVVSKAALLEYSNGSPERGRSIFEGLLDSYPKRTDLWSVYLDAHIKAHTAPRVAKTDFTEIRALLERCCASRMKVAKMRFFFKRWLDFEKQHGDAESQEMVRNKAREFVESQAA